MSDRINDTGIIDISDINRLRYHYYLTAICSFKLVYVFSNLPEFIQTDKGNQKVRRGRRMSGEAISSAILTIASIICAFSFVSVVYPSVISAGDPIISRTNAMGDQIQTDFEILHETTADEGSEIHIWVKNVGPKGISSGLIPRSDLFFGEVGKFERIPYDENGSLAPCWNYSIEQNNDDNWDKGETLQIRLKPVDVPVSRVKYFIKFSSYNGVSEEAYFTVS